MMLECRFTVDGEEGTPRDEGAQIQETVTALNDLEILVIGTGKSVDHNPALAPRSPLEAFAEATGAVYRGGTTLDNGTADPIDYGDPLYFNLYAVGGYTLDQGLFSGLSSQVIAVPGTIEGTVWDDLNDNGISDPGELSVGAGVTVYMDWNQNGSLDMGEYDTTTNANGEYSFLNLVPGEYHIGVELAATHELTTTSQSSVMVYSLSQIQLDIGIHEWTARDDSFVTDEDVPLEITISSLLANDKPAVPSTGHTVSFHAFEDAAHGTVTLDGLVLWHTPDADWFSEDTEDTDTFRYCLSDGYGYYDWATVRITVNPVNDAPRFHTLRTLQNTAISGTLAYDVDSPSIEVAVLGGASHAQSLEVNTDGTFSYTPNTGWYGVDRFVVSATDGEASTGATSIGVYVSAITRQSVGVQQFADPSLFPNSYWGSAVAASGDLLVVGQSLDPYDDRDVPVLIYKKPAAFVLGEEESPWQIVAQLSSEEWQDYFGCSVAVAGDTVVIGAKGDDERANDAGAVYVYRENGAEWELVAKLMAPVEESMYHHSVVPSSSHGGRRA